MDSGEGDGLHMLHFFMLEHMKELNMNEAAQVFAREARIGGVSFGFNHPQGFLSDWWCIFWDMYKSRVFNGFNGGEAGVEASTQALAQDNNGMEFHPDLMRTMGPVPDFSGLSAQQFPFHIDTANMMGSPEAHLQPAALPGNLNANIQEGWALPGSSPGHTIAEAPQNRRGRPRKQPGRATVRNPTSGRNWF